MNTVISYKDVFQLAESKGYLLSDYMLTENRTTDLHPTAEKAFIEMSLIQKWLRDTHKLIVWAKPYRDVYEWGLFNGGTAINIYKVATEGYSDSIEEGILIGINEALQLI
jgi:hypothetical protein